ncbi:MAG TPA: ester cyclase [Candidatus Dormibacteraeota bacterium]|jgi:predicted ester cyclase|nr:ester cyclase [Candidatus Dormibacteraeota bacterium]
MTGPGNEAIYRRLIEEGFNQGNLAVADELVSPGAREHQRGSEDGPEGVKKTIKYLRSAFPDFKITIDEVVVSGDKVWARQRGGGTNLGSFAGHLPSGRKAFTEVIDICRIEDGKIVEHWGVPDQLGMMMQLGHITPPARPATVSG